MAAGRAGFWIRLCVIVIYPIDSLLFRLRWRGRDNVPRDGGVILAANHISYIDPLTFVRFVWDSGRIPRILIKASLFRNRLTGPIMRGARQIRVERDSAGAGDSLRPAAEALHRGEAVCIYPEGTVTRDPDWWPMQAKTGVARLALQTGAPVIPIAQWGAHLAYDRYHHRRDLWPRKQIQIAAGPPVDLSAFRDQPLTGELLRRATDTIMLAISAQLAVLRDEPAPAQLYQRPPGPATAADR